MRRAGRDALRLGEGGDAVGVTVGEWVFSGHDAPDLAAIGDALRRNTGLVVEEDHRWAPPALTVPALRETLFDWEIAPDRITVHSFIPAHPFLWEHLDMALAAFGGMPSGDAIAFRPDPSRAWLRRRWDALSRRNRRILGLPSVLAARPFDRFLMPEA